MAPQGAHQRVRKEHVYCKRCSSHGSSSSTYSTSIDDSSEDSRGSPCNSRTARRSRAYDNIMRQWELAATLAMPTPRPTHRRVLGGEALPTLKRGESFSLETSSTNTSPSWGNLSDTMSPGVQLAWREQLLRLKLSGLAGVPRAVLLRQLGSRGTGADSPTEVCRVVSACPYLSAQNTALAVIEGTCLDSPLFAPSRSSVRSTARVPIGGYPGSGTSIITLREFQAEAAEQQQDGLGIAAMNFRDAAEEKVFMEARWKSESTSQGWTSGSTASMRSRSSSLPPSLAHPLMAKPPVRGFHLVDLHAVVRNAVEWKHCLPKVEPCFRVSSNRDGVLLGLVHALGGRLSCSSAHDISAGSGAARRANPLPAPPPRLLDHHVCRSPTLLRASVAAGVQLYEVDSADEWGRIHAAREKHGSVGAGSIREIAYGCSRTTAANARRASDAGPAGVVVRLAMPQLPGDSTSAYAAADMPGYLEAVYGASAEDVVELVHAAMDAAVGGEGRSKATASPWNDSSGGCSLPIVGFSIDVGAACWDDAFASGGAAQPSSGPGRPDGSGPTSVAATGGTGAASNEAVPSTTLAESIDAAVAFAVKMAGIAAEAVAAACIARTAASAVAEEGPNGQELTATSDGGGGSSSRSITPPLSPSSRSPPPFSFRRLHVTGLGKGGARGEPLSALKAALSRHLSTAGCAGTTRIPGSSIESDGGSGLAWGPNAPANRLVLVSADATEHLIAAGVCSTVASIIGRKSITPLAADVRDDSATMRPPPPEECGVAGAGGDEGCCPVQEGTTEGDPGGTMYYIDDGCYGSLSGALLRGVQMQPLPLRVRVPGPERRRDSSPPPVTAVTPAAAGETSAFSSHDGYRARAAAALKPPDARELPCKVWGPTCDGLDCVCRKTQLPDDLEPGRDWLFFPDVGIRGGADATHFNGLQPLDSYYCIRQSKEAARSPVAAAPPAPSFWAHAVSS